MTESVTTGTVVVASGKLMPEVLELKTETLLRDLFIDPVLQVFRRLMFVRKTPLLSESVAVGKRD